MALENGPPGPLATPSAPRRRRVWLIVTAVAVALAVVLGALWAAGVFTEKSAVPDVVDATLSSAQTKLDDAGFELGSVTYEEAVGKPQGVILSQSPAAGTQAEHGSAVNLVAVGTSLQVVPNVTGMTQSEAKAAITSAGLAMGSVALVYSDTAPAETVTGQAPAAGVEAPSDSQVAISVSRGPAPEASPSATAVPNVIGMSESEAVAALQAAGFVVFGDKVPSTTVPANTVSAQSPSGGVLAQPGTNVTIVVSTGSSTASPAP
jgi:eukaryotic-like serine/threonine-protein kinase